MRTQATINRLNMYKKFKPIRNKSGEIIKAAPFQGWNASGTVARVEPNRKWFGNTRVITQNALQKFQDDMKTIKDDPYKVVMKQSTLPITLLNEKAKVSPEFLLTGKSLAFDADVLPEYKARQIAHLGSRDV